MKTHEWSPGRRYKALGLIEGGRHSLREITNITNIPKGTLGDLKKRDTGISKPRSGRPKTLSSRDLRHIEIYIRTSHTTRRTPIPRLISLLDLQAHPNTVRKALIGLGTITELLVVVLSSINVIENVDYNMPSGMHIGRWRIGRR